MAKVIHESWKCDRCGASLGEKPPQRLQPITVSWSANYAEGPGPSGKWTDLCDSCDDILRAFFLRNHEPSEANRREAAAWVRELCEREATGDARDHIPPRAARDLLSLMARCVGWRPGHEPQA